MNKKIFQALALLATSVCYGQCWPDLFNCLTITPKVGVAPTVFTNRECITIVFPNTIVTSPVFSIGETPKFNKLFKVPVYVGGEISWQQCENVEAFLELDYRHAKGKCVQIPTTILGTSVVFGADLSSFKALGFYGGARSGWQSWCDYFSWFVGAKVGLVHHSKINGNITSNNIAIQCSPIFLKNTVVSGGAQLGIEKYFTDCFGLVLNAEVVASGGLRNNSNVVIADTTLGIGVTNVNFASIGTEVSFPVSIGFNISF